MINILICFLAPWLAMFLRGKVLQGILCIILHITIIAIYTVPLRLDGGTRPRVIVH